MRNVTSTANIPSYVIGLRSYKSVGNLQLATCKVLYTSRSSPGECLLYSFTQGNVASICAAVASSLASRDGREQKTVPQCHGTGR